MKKHFVIYLLGVLLLSDASDPPKDREITAASQENIVSYIQNFKETMSSYVYNQHQNLPENAKAAVKNTLEDFLVTFANDLKSTVENTQKTEQTDIYKIEDGLPDGTFTQIKERIKGEFPDVTDAMAEEIVFKLRKNLFVTKQRLDQIIRDSAMNHRSEV